MVGIVFTVTLLALLGAVGFLFAWMVRLASTQESDQAQPQLQVAPIKTTQDNRRQH